MTKRRFLQSICFVLITVTAAPQLAAAAADPAEFIRTLGNQALEVIRSEVTPGEKAAYFHRALKEDFDLRGISRFVLGPYWRVASQAQQQEFQRLLEDYLVHFYGRRFARYGGEKLVVTGSRSDASGAVVTSEIMRPQGPPIQVVWRLDVRDGHYKITDVSIDGVSMALTQRAEFGGIIQRNGGQMAALLAMMREDSGGGVGSSAPGR